MSPGTSLERIGGQTTLKKITEIGQGVAEKIEFEKKNWRPLAAKPEAFEVT